MLQLELKTFLSPWLKSRGEGTNKSARSKINTLKFSNGIKPISNEEEHSRLHFFRHKALQLTVIGSRTGKLHGDERPPSSLVNLQADRYSV